MKALIAGSGKVAREILSRLGETWTVTLVDTAGEKMNVFKETFDQVVKTITGDASSIVTLTEAGLEEQDFVVAITNRDEVNLEVARLAKDRGVENIVALANDSRNMKKFEAIDVRAVCGPFLVAREVQLYMENPRLFVTTIAEGKGEIMEIEVGRVAPVVGAKVRELGAKDWLIGAVYRNDELIIPDSETVIMADDRITLVGHTDLYQAIFHYFKLDMPSFPLRYGQNILAFAEKIEDVPLLLPEAFYLVKNTQARKAVIYGPEELEEAALSEAEKRNEQVAVEFRKIGGNPVDAIVSASKEESVGCVLIPPARSSFLSTIFGKERFVSLARRLGAPLMMPRNSHPYTRILVPYNATKMAALSLEIAHDISRQVKGKISVVIVSEPLFIRGEGAEGWPERAAQHAREIARIYRIPIELITLEGNTVKEVVRVAADHDLLIIGSTTNNVPFLKPNVGELIAERSPCSVMVVTL
jgi:trk system potassium uptake protein TrkA